MEHLKRAGILLAVLLIGFIALQLMPSPDSLESFGFYDKTGNAAKWSSLQPLFNDTSACNDCHQEKYKTWTEAAHGVVSCENCHGPAAAHVQSTEVNLLVVTSREACGICHGELISRPDGFPQVDLAIHGGTADCTACHNPHKPGFEIN